MEDIQSESIDFFAKYKDWTVVKRMTIRPDTKPEEISFHLAGIRQTLDKKAFFFLGIDMQKLDDYATNLTAGKRKSFSDLAESVGKLASAEAKAAVKDACGGKPEHSEIASAYLLRQVAQKLGFDVDVNQLMLSKVYKDLKIKKPLGRQKKQ